MGRPSPARERSGRRSASNSRSDRASDASASWVTLAIPLTAMTFVGLIMLAMSPYTYNLDDLKETLFHFLGPILFLLAVAGVALGVVPLPPKIVGLGLAAYGLALVVSTLHSAYPWIGRIMLLFYFSCFGFYFGGLASGSNKKASGMFLIFVAVMLLLVNLLGFFQFDLFGTGRTGVTFLYHMLYGEQTSKVNSPPLQQLLYTFTQEPVQQLMSTVLNRDFYAGFCLLYFPFVAALALISRNWFWRACGIITTLTSLFTIFLCQSKGEYFTAVVSIAFFAICYAVFIRHGAVRGSHIAIWAGGMALVLATFMLLNFPTLSAQLKTVSGSLASRKIMFAGAWRIFLHFPVFGSGPGAYRIYFPEYRSADYFRHEINNVTTFSHDYFLDILCETGLVGFITYVTFAGSLAILAFRALWRVKDVELRLLFIATLSGLLGIYGSNLTSPNARWPIGALGIWTVLGYLSGLVSQADGWIPATVDFDARPPNSMWSGMSGWPRWGKGLLAATAILAVIATLFSFHEGTRYWASSRDYNDGKQIFRSINDEVMSVIPRRAQTDPGQVQALTSYMQRSAKSFENAIEEYPEYTTAYYQLGSVDNLLSMLAPETEESRLEKAKLAYEKLESLDPDYAELPYNLGVIYYRLYTLLESRNPSTDKEPRSKEIQDQIDRYRNLSVANFKKMGVLSKKPEVYYQLGEAYINQGDYKLAQETLEEGVKLYYDDPTIEPLQRSNLLKSYLKSSVALGDKRSQADALKRMWLLQPGQVDLLFSVKGQSEGCLDIALQNGFDDQFEEILKLALDRNPVDANLYARDVTYAARKKVPDRALKSALAYLKLGGDDPEVLKIGAQAAGELKNVEASKAFEAALAGR